MILPLHTGRKSAPVLALFDTTGIAVMKAEAAAPSRHINPDSEHWRGREDELRAAQEQETACLADLADLNHRNAMVWYGSPENGVYVHETVEEIAALMGVATGSVVVSASALATVRESVDVAIRVLEVARYMNAADGLRKAMAMLGSTLTTKD